MDQETREQIRKELGTGGESFSFPTPDGGLVQGTADHELSFLGENGNLLSPASDGDHANPRLDQNAQHRG
jgi:hypothetical protein